MPGRQLWPSSRSLWKNAEHEMIISRLVSTDSNSAMNVFNPNPKTNLLLKHLLCKHSELEELKDMLLLT